MRLFRKKFPSRRPDPEKYRVLFDQNLAEIQNSQNSFWSPESSWSRNLEIENFLKNIGADFVQHEILAYYPHQDTISIPKTRRFHQKEDYYSILFHELGHWTEHKDRLNRTNRISEDNKIIDKDSKIYNQEEIIAELVSIYLCETFKITPSFNRDIYLKSILLNYPLSTQDLEFCHEESLKAVDYLLTLHENAENP